MNDELEFLLDHMTADQEKYYQIGFAEGMRFNVFRLYHNYRITKEEALLELGISEEEFDQEAAEIMSTMLDIRNQYEIDTSTFMDDVK